MHGPALLRHETIDLPESRIGRWIVKEDPDLLRAQILIPKEDVRSPGFGSDFMWLLSFRYNIDRFEAVYRRMVTGLRRLGKMSEKTGPGKACQQPIPLDEDDRGKPLDTGRQLSIVYYEKNILLVIMGRAAMDGTGGALGSIRFNHKKVPGKQNSDGSMNWYELGKFMVVDQGDELCTILDPVEGDYGVDIFNQPLIPSSAETYSIDIGKGIHTSSFGGGDDGRTGIQLSAGLKGVLTFTHDSRGALRAIDVKEQIKTRSISFKTGNIGAREVKIPVPVFLEEFRPDFKLFSSAFVKCSEVCGGFIHTDDTAELGIVNSGSHIQAGKEIRAEFVQKSRLEAPQVTVTKNIIDVRVRADRFTAQGEKIFAITNTEIDAVTVRMNQVLIQGNDNIIDLGRSLIREKQDAHEQACDAQNRILLLEEEKELLLASVRDAFAGAIKKSDPDKRARLIALARKMSTLSASGIRDALDRVKGYANMGRVESLKQKLAELNAAKSGIHEKEDERDRAAAQRFRAKDRINGISYRISGFVAPGATLKIRCDEWETVYSADGEKHLSLSLAGNMRPDGKIRETEAVCRQVQNPLSYPQVRIKDAQAHGI